MRSLEEIIADNKEADKKPKTDKQKLFKQIKREFNIDKVSRPFDNEIKMDLINKCNCLSSGELILLNQLIADKKIEIDYLGLRNGIIRLTLKIL